MGEGGLCVPEIETCTGVTVRPVSICVSNSRAAILLLAKIGIAPSICKCLLSSNKNPCSSMDGYYRVQMRAQCVNFIRILQIRRV